MQDVNPECHPMLRERRIADRRKRHWWSVWYGGFRPRRRSGRRSEDTQRFPPVDWHASHLLPISIAILLLSAGDAALTISLLSGGAIEVNPIMALLIGRHAIGFAVIKTALTGVGVVSLVAAARYRFLRAVRVEIALYAVLAGYLVLIGYELWLLHRLGPIGT